MKILVTGAAGFIGYHVCRRLVEPPGRAEVLGIDNLDRYYSVELKQARLAELERFEDFRFVHADFADPVALAALSDGFKPDYIVHLGAQTGVRHSLLDPGAYVHSNLVGFANVLEAARRHPPKHTVFASSSSVYGIGPRPPFREDDVGEPLSFYAATKRANEQMASSYAHMYGLRLTGLRFFTVYGPWGRPDMAPIRFARAIMAGETIPLWNRGQYRRDFTYIDDIVDGVLKILLYPAPRAASVPSHHPSPRYRIFNLGHHRPVEMLLFTQMLEAALGRSARVEFLPPEPTEMPETCADLTRVQTEYGFAPKVSLEEGLKRFVAWFRHYYAVA